MSPDTRRSGARRAARRLPAGSWLGGLACGTLIGCAQLLGADFDAKTTNPDHFAGASGKGDNSGGRPSSGGATASGGVSPRVVTGGADASGGSENGSGGASGGEPGSGGEAGAGTIDCTQPGDCSADAVVINEVSGEGRPDFIELYNGGEKPADLAGYSLTDGATAPDAGHLSEIPAGTILEPGKFLYFQEDERPLVNCVIGGDRCLWFGFGISKDGDTVFLLTPDSEVQDSVIYPADGPSVGLDDTTTWGRFPDGEDEFGALIPTEKGPNVKATM